MTEISDKIIIAADLGNSRIKLMINGTEGDSPYSTKMYFSFSYTEDMDWIDKVTELFQHHSGRRIVFCYSSVNITRLEVLLSRLDEFKGIRLKSAEDLIDNSGIVGFSSIDGMGTDRKLSLYGGLNYIEPPFITIDAGTAITINVLDSEKKCLGGSIMPGIYTQIKSLADTTSGLNIIQMNKPLKTAAKNTKEALRAGIIIGSFGAIKEIIAGIIAEEMGGSQIPVIATGGAISLLEPYLSEHYPKFMIYPNLVLDGIEYLLKNY
jgi:pantothenate kinase type III